MIRRESGFTIIETSLVLAVTGLIIAVVLAGIGNSLNHQRYTDAVNQAVDFFRGQYTQTTSVMNNRPADESCSALGVSVAASPMSRGASDCLLLGQVIRSSNGQDITVSQLLALHDPSDDTNVASASDADILSASQLEEGSKVDEYSLEWGARLLAPSSKDAAKFTLVVLRVPVSGTVRTYSSVSDTIPVADLVRSPDASADDLRVCVDQSGFFGGVGVSPVGIAIDKGANNTTGVKIIPSGDCA